MFQCFVKVVLGDEERPTDVGLIISQFQDSHAKNGMFFLFWPRAESDLKLALVVKKINFCL